MKKGFLYIGSTWNLAFSLTTTVISALVILISMTGCGNDNPTAANKPMSSGNLVEVDLSYVSALNNKEFPNALRQEFLKSGIDISENITVRRVHKENKWTINDKENKEAFSATANKAKIKINRTTFIDYEAEREAIVELYKNYVKYYNSKKRIEVFKLWTAKESDYFYVEMWKRESVDGKGPKPVKNAITFLQTGPVQGKRDAIWTGSNVNKVYIRHKRNRLEASIHSPNGWFEGQTWGFFIKEGTKWKINKLESVRNQTITHEANSFKIQIHENNQLDSIGYFDNPKDLVE